MTARTVLLVLLALLARLVAPAPSGAAAAAEPRVAAIAVVGAARTSRATVLDLARVHEGDPWRETLAAEARQHLLNTRIFYDVEVTPERAEDGVRLTIALKEKWTLIPIPLVLVKDGETTWGASIIESNLFGSASLLFASLAVTGGEPGGSLMYADSRVGGTRVQFFGLARRTDQRTDVWDADRTTGSYRLRSTGGAAALGYRFAERTSISLGLRATDFSFGDPQQGATAPANAVERGLSAMLRHEGTDFDDDRRLGFSAELRLERGLEALGDRLGREAASGHARWALRPVAGHTLGFSGYALYTDAADYETSSRTGSGFLRGYEADRFRPDRLLGGSVEYQVPAARFRAATVSIVPFADAALLRDGYRRFALEDAQVDAGLALAVYLRRIALPVLQLYGAYGFSSGEVLPGFSLGLSF